jgi:large subunit ribosomal protein L28
MVVFMARKCDISGKRTQVGNTISHSHIRTKRKFKVNLFKKKVYLPDENRYVTLKVSARMLKALNKNGVKALMKKYGQDLSILKKK